jgi:hypothetical protein
MWHRVIWYKVSRVADEPTAPVFRVEGFTWKMVAGEFYKAFPTSCQAI